MLGMRRWFASLIGVCTALAATILPTAALADAPQVLRLRVGEIATAPESSLLAPAQRGIQVDPDGAYVIQLREAVTAEQRAALADAGVRLGHYLPDFAYIVNLQGADIAELARLGFVHWVGEYADGWKIDPAIGQRTAPFQTPERIATAAEGKYQLALTFFAWSDLQTGIDALEKLNVDVRIGEMVGDQGMVGVVVDQGRLGELAALPFVQYIEESAEITLRNGTNRWIVQSNILNVTPLYNAGIHGENQVVGVIDGKINVNHCSFSDTNPIGPSHRKILAYNTTLGSSSHGTHVAGTVAGDNGVDDNTRGVAYLGKIVFDDIPSFTETAINTMLTLHHDQGARVHTNSWGDDGTTSYNGLARGFDLFQYNHEESLCCLAVTNTSTLKNPENAKNLLAVGASQDTPNQGNFCSGGTGPTADGRRKPEIFAPGCSTNSSSSSTSCGTTALTGTSMASPAVAGTAMLVRQYYTDGYYPSGAPEVADAFNPSAALVKATLLNSAVDMTGIAGYPSNQEGWGRVLADNALYFPGDARNLIVLADVFNAGGMTTAEFENYQFSVASSAQSLRLTLTFTDVPGTSGSATPVVNNLDLELTDPSGTIVYKGNNFSAGVSAPGGSADALNNVEQILINSPVTGIWTAKVKATAVNQGTQGYALVATGDINLGPLPPVAESQSLETSVDNPLMIQLVATDVDFDPLDFVITSLPASGTLVDPQAANINSAPYTLANGGSQVEYQPIGGYVGSVSFTFKADDGGVPPDGGLSNTASVDILVKANDPQILTTSLPDGDVYVAYGPEQIVLTGGQPPIVWEIVADVPYIEEDLGTSGFAEVGVAQGWFGDDVNWVYDLPFTFQFYNSNFTQVRVWSNGFINFGTHTGSSHNNSDATLLLNRRIAPLWDDLRTNAGGTDIYIDESISGQVTIRWDAVTYSGGHPVNCAVTLHESGAIDLHYGSGNTPVTPTVGVSDGDGLRHTLSTYNNAANLGGANSVRLSMPEQLSPGLSLSPTGQLVGTPTVPGDFLPVIRVTDSLNRTDEAAIALFIRSVLGDFDQDGDIDGDDLLVFTDCLNGPLAAPPAAGPPPTDADCLAVFDFDASSHVDLRDFAALQGVMAP